QGGERVAHGGLRQMQTLAGRRDAAVAVDRIENREQIQVDPGKLHWRAPCRTLGAQYAQGRSGAMQPLHWRSRGAARTLAIAINQETVMDFEYSPRVRSLQAKLLKFVEQHIYPNEARYSAEVAENRSAGNAFKALKLIEDLKPRARDAQLWNLFLPRSPRAPEGLSNLEYAPLCEIMGRVPWSPEVFNCAAPDTGNMEILERYASEKNKERWLKPLLNGEIRSAFCMTEPAVASSDATNIETSIRREGNHYVINGLKWWSSGAGDTRCKVLIVMGKTDPSAAKHAQQSQIVVPMDTPGVQVLRMLPVFGFDDAPHGHAEIVFENVRVPVDNVLLGEGRGFEIAQARLGPGRIHHCMRNIGVAERLLERICRRLSSRVAIGQPIY